MLSPAFEPQDPAASSGLPRHKLTFLSAQNISWRDQGLFQVIVCCFVPRLLRTQSGPQDDISRQHRKEEGQFTLAG